MLAVDVEPAALEATTENAERNGVEVEVRRANLRREPAPYAPTVLANLVRPLLLDVARPLERAPERLIASGLLREEADEVAGGVRSHGLTEKDRRFGGEWAAVLLQRCERPGGDELVGGARVGLDDGAGLEAPLQPPGRDRRVDADDLPVLAEPDQVEREAHRERVHGAAARDVQREPAGIASSLARPFMRAARVSASATRRPPARSRPGRPSSRGQASADAELAAATAASSATATSATAAAAAPGACTSARRGRRRVAAARRRRGAAAGGGVAAGGGAAARGGRGAAGLARRAACWRGRRRAPPA